MTDHLAVSDACAGIQNAISRSAAVYDGEFTKHTHTTSRKSLRSSANKTLGFLHPDVHCDDSQQIQTCPL